MHKRLSVKIRMLLVALFISTCTLGQEPAQMVRGTWTATVGKARVLQGRWAGGALPQQPDVAVGTWTLESGGHVVMHGRWRAEKSHRGWEGFWSGHTALGESMAGSWGADLQHWHRKTLQDMLNRTLQQEVTGWWKSGHQEGDWWLKGSS